MLERVAISFSRISSRPRGRTQASRIARRHFTLWATREAPTTRELEKAWAQQPRPNVAKNKQTNKQTKTPQKTNLLTSKKGSPTSKKLSIKKKLQINNCKSGDKDILTLGLWFILPFKKWFINYSHCCLLLFSHCHVWVFAPPWIVARLLCPWGFPGKNTGVGYHFLLQGIFLSQELNLHWRVDSLPQTTWEAPINYSCVRMHSVLPSNPTLGHPVDCSPPGSSVHGILQARTLEWVTTPSSRASSPPRDWTQISCVYCIASRPYTAEPPGKPKLFTVLYKYEVITGMTLQLYYEPGLFSKGEKPSLPYFHH